MTRIGSLLLLGTLLVACGDDDDGVPVDAGDGSDAAGFDATPGEDGGRGDGATPDEDMFVAEADMGVDMGPEPCDSPGSIETVECGDCGTTERFCSAEGFWSYGACMDEGVCSPGTTQTIACGNCGMQEQRCTASCEWTNNGSCTDESGCTPGETLVTSEGCPAGETQELTCSDSCIFESGVCEADRCDTPGEIEDLPCGLCGTRERFCTAERFWEYGECEGEGVCMPGTTGSETCGRCGTQNLRCTSSCQWDPTGSCMAQGECTPGSQTRTDRGCPVDETRVLECDAMCSYTIQVEACMPTVPVDVVFLVDATGSHWFDFESARTTFVTRCVDPLLAVDDVEVGLAFYGDFDSFGSFDEPFEASVEPGRGTSAAISTSISSQSQLGGADDSTMEALNVLSGGTPAASSVPFTCTEGGDGGCWRSGAERVIVMFTDEGAKGGPDPAGSGVWNPWPAATSPDWTTVGPALMSDGTRLYVANDVSNMSDIDPAGQYEEMVSDLGGVAGDVYYGRSSFGTHCDAIVAKIIALTMP